MNLDRLRRGAPHERVGLFRFAGFTALAVVFLLLAGAAVKTTESGLSVPDWPLSFGKLMPEMKGGVFFEHGHRMVATGVGLLTVILAFWTWMRDPRPALRRLGWIALATVILQGVLGGMTVLLKLPVWTSAAHACLAQGFFLVVVFMTLSFSRGWNTADPLPAGRDSRLPLLAAVATGAIYTQLILGAVTRHMEAALVIPTVPPLFLFPPPAAFIPEVAMHYAHRVGAVVVTIAVFAAALTALRAARGRRDFTVPAVLMMLLVVVQFSLGVMIVLTQRQLHVTNTHVVTGALLLAASFVLTARSWKFARSAETVAARSRSKTAPRLGKATA